MCACDEEVDQMHNTLFRELSHLYDGRSKDDHRLYASFVYL